MDTRNSIHLNHTSRFIYETLYLQLCYQSSHPWKHRISYSGQLQGRFNFRLMFATLIVHSSILSVSLTDIIPNKQISLLAMYLLGKPIPGAQNQALGTGCQCMHHGCVVLFTTHWVATTWMCLES